MAAPETLSDAPRQSPSDSSSFSNLWKLIYRPFTAGAKLLGRVLSLPGKVADDLFHDIPVLNLTSYLLNPLTVAAGALAGGYHAGWFNNLNFAIPGIGTNVALGDALNYGGRTVSVGAQNFWNWVQRDTPYVGTGTDNTIYGQREGQTFMPGVNPLDPTPLD